MQTDISKAEDDDINNDIDDKTGDVENAVKSENVEETLEDVENDNVIRNSAHADWGPCSRVCARETLRSVPRRRERKCSGACVCRVTFKIFRHPCFMSNAV